MLNIHLFQVNFEKKNQLNIFYTNSYQKLWGVKEPWKQMKIFVCTLGKFAHLLLREHIRKKSRIVYLGSKTLNVV